jgi:hypothetical protein
MVLLDVLEVVYQFWKNLLKLNRYIFYVATIPFADVHPTEAYTWVPHNGLRKCSQKYHS